MSTHGDSYVVTGSGFGTKDAQTIDLWDNCSHGNEVLKSSGGLYDLRWHDQATGQEDYRDPANYPSATSGIGLPHSHITKVLCGEHQGTGIESSDVYVTRYYERPGTSWWMVRSYYFAISQDWDFTNQGTADNNFKHFFIASGSKYAANSQYAYVEARNADFTSNTVDHGVYWNDADLIGSSPQLIDSTIDQTNQVALGWHKIEQVIKYSESSDGVWKYTINNSELINTTLQTHDSTAYEGKTNWQETFGGFTRHRNAGNARFWADIWRDVNASNPGRFVIGNSATWSSCTLREYQPYTAWSTTSVTLTLNQGAIPDGTAHLHYRDEVNGNQYIGTLTFGAGGSPSDSGGSFSSFRSFGNSLTRMKL